jgi:putative ubiquitin-RnfH superfamily antitoxin RatB of RatAB toxin-antitoxin module
MRIEVVYAAAPHDVRQAVVQLDDGATVADALRASRLLEPLAAAEADALQPSIWGRSAALDARLRDGDRVELTRGLLVDPKEARRQRYRRDGVRGRRRDKKATGGSPTR